jgi:outer membrane protein assembly factor BamB
LWKSHRRELLAGGVLVLCGLIGLVVYTALKRPGDINDTDAPFIANEPPPRRGSVNWPTYGFDNARTRYLPRRGIKPPFRKVWLYQSGGVLMEFSPIVVDGTVYGIDNHGHAFALSADSGKVIWKRQVGSLNASSPAYHDGRLFFVNLEPNQAVALDAATGKTIWERELPGRSESSPAVEEGKVVFGCECSELFALDEGTGKIAWQRRLDGAIKGGPAVKDGVVFAGDYSGNLSAVRLDDGSIKWQSSDQGRGLGRSGAFYATPAVAFGRVYIGNKDGRMYSFVAETGKLAWTHSTGDQVYAAPAVADTPTAGPSVYFGSIDGKAYALDAETGKERWVRAAGGSVLGAGSVVGQIFYVANVSKRATVGFATKTGKRVFGKKVGAYNPVISDGRRLYLTGYAGVEALKPRPPGTALTKEQKQAKIQAAAQRKAQKEAKTNKNRKKGKGKKHGKKHHKGKKHKKHGKKKKGKKN